MRRFSLLELVTVLAILSVLTALALPQWFRVRADTHMTEARINYNSLVDQLRVQWASEPPPDVFRTPINPNPLSVGLGSHLRPWAQRTEWNQIGWRPDGDVRCSYYVAYFPETTTWREWNVYVWCDLDEDGVKVQVEGQENFERSLSDPLRVNLFVSCINASTTVNMQALNGSMAWSAKPDPPCR